MTARSQHLETPEAKMFRRLLTSIEVGSWRTRRMSVLYRSSEQDIYKSLDLVAGSQSLENDSLNCLTSFDPVLDLPCDTALPAVAS